MRHILLLSREIKLHSALLFNDDIVNELNRYPIELKRPNITFEGLPSDGI